MSHRTDWPPCRVCGHDYTDHYSWSCLNCDCQQLPELYYAHIFATEDDDCCSWCGHHEDDHVSDGCICGDCIAGYQLPVLESKPDPNQPPLFEAGA